MPPATAPDTIAPPGHIEAGPRGHIEKRLSIIDAAACVFCREGFGGTNIDMVAAQANVSRQTVYNHHGDKEKLFRAVLEYLNDQFARLWEETVGKPGLSPAERIVASIDCARHFRRQHPDWVSVWVLFGSDRQTMQLDKMISLPSDRAYLDQSRRLLAAKPVRANTSRASRSSG